MPPWRIPDADALKRASVQATMQGFIGLQHVLLNLQAAAVLFILVRWCKLAHALPSFYRAFTRPLIVALAPLAERCIVLATVAVLGGFWISLLLGPEAEEYSSMSNIVATSAVETLVGARCAGGCLVVMHLAPWSRAPPASRCDTVNGRRCRILREPARRAVHGWARAKRTGGRLGHDHHIHCSFLDVLCPVHLHCGTSKASLASCPCPLLPNSAGLRVRRDAAHCCILCCVGMRHLEQCSSKRDAGLLARS